MCAQGRRTHGHDEKEFGYSDGTRTVELPQQKFKPAGLRSLHLPRQADMLADSLKRCTEHQFLSTIRNNERA